MTTSIGPWPERGAVICLEASVYRSPDNPLPTVVRGTCGAHALLCGDVRHPLNETAALTGYLFGDGLALLRRSTHGFCRLGLRPTSEATLLGRMLEGTGRLVQARLPVWIGGRGGPLPVCQVCLQKYWIDPGCLVYLYPHFFPFVSTCWDHGTVVSSEARALEMLERRSAIEQGDYRAQRYAQVCLLMNDRSAGGADVLGDLHTAAEAAGYCYPGGRLHVAKFSHEFGLFCREQIVDPALRHLALLPLRGRDLLHALVNRERPTHPVYLALAYWFLLIEPAPGSQAPFEWAPRVGKAIVPKGNWGVKGTDDVALRKIDRRVHYEKPDARGLLLAGCAPKSVAMLCGTTTDWVYCFLKREELWPAAVAARRSVITRDARWTWLKKVASHPDRSAHQIGRCEPRLMKWLQRWDKAWLDAHRPVFYSRAFGSPRHVRAPKGRDTTLAARVRRAAATLRRRSRFNRVSMATLATELGVTPYALEACARWPRVKAALTEAGAYARKRKPSTPQRK